MERMGLGLYIHIPFCHVKCRFCSFAAFPGRLDDIPRYLAALKKDLGLLAAGDPPALDSLYFGGGTPTVLAPGQWHELMSAIREFFVLLSPEITVECNPESTTPEKLSAFRSLGVNRLSFGLQSTQDVFLKDLGRLHDM